MKAADRSGAQVAVIVGSDELDHGTAVVRPLRERSEQSVVPRADLVTTLQDLLQKAVS
jgi:histidyl-tRNA synthetase